jgi:hypothetical protein
VEHPDVLHDRSLSVAQKMCLKAIYGLPLTAEELEVFGRASGRHDYVAAEAREATIIAGRRAGKTSKIAARLAIYESVRDHGLPPGEEGFVMVLAPTISQARIAFRFILGDLRRSPTLSKRIISTTKDEIRLDNGITIGCYASTYDGVRGRTVVAAICDEVAFWSQDDTAANPAEEVLAALRPAMIAVRNPKLLKISTPYCKYGMLWEEYQRRSELDYPVLQLSSFELNPTLDPALLDRERHRGEDYFQREYLAQFVEVVNGWIVPELLEPCVVRGRYQLPYTPEGRFMTVMDPALVHDDFAFAVLRLTSDGRIVLHRVVRWSGTKTAPLGCDDVLDQVRSVLAEYRINSVTGDQYCSELIRQQLEKRGIYYQVRNFDARTRPEIFANLRYLLSQRRIELLDSPELLQELRSLQEHRTDRGQVDIRPASGGKDDLAVVVALAASELCKEQEVTPFLLPERALLPTLSDSFGRPTTLNVEKDIGEAIVNGRALTGEQENRLLFGRD